MITVEHKRDWSDWQPGDDGCSCSCGFNGTFEECAASRAQESAVQDQTNEQEQE